MRAGRAGGGRARPADLPQLELSPGVHLAAVDREDRVLESIRQGIRGVQRALDLPHELERHPERSAEVPRSRVRDLLQPVEVGPSVPRVNGLREAPIRGLGGWGIP